MPHKPDMICDLHFFPIPFTLLFDKKNMSPKLALQMLYNLTQTAAVQPVFTHLKTSQQMVIAAHIVLCTCTGQYMEDVT